MLLKLIAIAVQIYVGVSLYGDIHDMSLTDLRIVAKLLLVIAVLYAIKTTWNI